jgi:phospholipid/cholesterol/gamma-HCH transport system permease protein
MAAAVGKVDFLVRETGNMFAIALEGLRKTFRVQDWWKEYLAQCWFIAKVTSIPVMLVSIPFGAVIALQVGSFNRQLGAESATGAAMVLAIVREAAPIAAALMIAGAGGSAMTADLGSRKIRDEIAAMEVMAVNPVHRLVTPRLWAATTVAIFLVSLCSAKAAVFGFIAAMVACYKGLYAKGGPKGVGDAVNQAVVVTFILIFFANFVMTTLYFALVPQKF